MAQATASRVALIAGYGTGISAAVAKKLAVRGFKLALISRTQAKLDAAAVELSQQGYAAKGYAADLTDDKALRAAVANVQKELGPVHLLFWNPYGGIASYESATTEQLVGEFSATVTGLVAAFQASHENLKATKGAILVTGALLALEEDASIDMGLAWGATTFAVAKAAQRKLVHLMHKGLADDGIYVAEVTVMAPVRGTPFDPEGKSPLTAEAIADEFWSLYTKRDPAVWFVKL